VALQTILAIISTVGSGLTVCQVFRTEKAPRPEEERISDILSLSKPAALATGSLPTSSRSRVRPKDLKPRTSEQFALVAMNRGLAYCQQGQINQGMLWLARSLQLAPAGDEHLQQLIRANLVHWRTSLNALQFDFPHPGQVECVGFSSDGKIAFTLCHIRSSATDQHSEVRVWDLSSGQQIGETLMQKELVSVADLSPDGTILIHAGPGSFAWLWDVQAGKPIGQLLCHEREITCVAMSSDSQLVIMGSADHTAHLWNARNGQPIGSPLPHQGAVTAVAFSPDGGLAATASEDGAARLWDSATGRSQGFLMKHDGPVRALAFNSDGHMLLSAGDDRCARLWDTTTGSPIGKPLIHPDRVQAVTFSSDGLRFATGCADRTARVWETAVGKQETSLPHHSAVKSVQFNLDGHKLLTTSMDFRAQLWDLGSHKKVGCSLSLPDRVITALLSPDGKRILTGSQEGSAKLWEIGDPSRNTPSPDPMTDEVGQIVTWVERVTGTKIDSIPLSDSEEPIAIHSRDD
jgi:WD40 repeat protein